MMLSTIDQDAEVFYEIGRLQHLLETITALVGDMDYVRDGKVDEELHRLNSLTWIADGMLRRISEGFDAEFKKNAPQSKERAS